MNAAHPNAAHEQRERVLARLRDGPASTLDLRREQDVLSPAGRVRELRNMGYNIVTQWVQRPTDGGLLHRVGLYVYRGFKQAAKV